MKFSNYKLVKKAEFQWDEGVFFGGKFMKNIVCDLWVLEAMRVPLSTKSVYTGG